MAHSTDNISPFKTFTYKNTREQTFVSLNLETIVV